MTDIQANSSASAIIDIITVFDTQTLLAKGKSIDSNRPTWLAHEDIFMVVNKEYLKENQASADLGIKAIRNDIIRWRAVSLSGNAAETACFYKFEHNTGDRVTSDIKFSTNQAEVAIPHDGDPIKFDIKDQYTVYMQGEVKTKGTEQYKLYFYITQYDRSTGKYTAYYFAWDPSITVQS